mgnify:FL=1
MRLIEQKITDTSFFPDGINYDIILDYSASFKRTLFIPISGIKVVITKVNKSAVEDLVKEVKSFVELEIQKAENGEISADEFVKKVKEKFQNRRIMIYYKSLWSYL